MSQGGTLVPCACAAIRPGGPLTWCACAAAAPCRWPPSAPPPEGCKTWTSRPPPAPTSCPPCFMPGRCTACWCLPGGPPRAGFEAGGHRAVCARACQSGAKPHCPAGVFSISSVQTHASCQLAMICRACGQLCATCCMPPLLRCVCYWQPRSHSHAACPTPACSEITKGPGNAHFWVCSSEGGRPTDGMTADEYKQHMAALSTLRQQQGERCRGRPSLHSPPRASSSMPCQGLGGVR